MRVAIPLTRQARRSLILVSRFWAWVFLLLLVVFFSLTGHGFFDLFNFQNIGANMAILMIMALGQTFVIISGGIDLSTGFVTGLASVASAMAMMRLFPAAPLPLVALLGLAGGVLAGVIAGLINGVMIGRLRVPPFIVTLGMLGIARGIGFILSGGQPIAVLINGIGQLGNGYLAYYIPTVGFTFFSIPKDLHGVSQREIIGILPYPLILMVLLIVICYWLLAHTRFGQHTYAIGGNREAALRAGIPVVSHTIKVYMLSSFLAALAGVLATLRFSNGAADVGDALLLDSIAAVVIGGASLFGGEGTIIGTVIGGLILAVIQNGLVILGIDAFWQFVAVGMIIILAVLVDQAKARITE
ncbi:MAG: ABC transporter permease [Ktedonobacteraceae bacterium]|nr:ABC transporter permease [Ktedonobacteraceae bacterium]